MASILVIDDHAAVLETVKVILAKQGHEIRTAPNGKAGMTYMSKKKFDLIITDIIMPEQDGIETIAQLRENLWFLPWVAEQQTLRSAEARCRKAQSDFQLRLDLPYLVFDRRTGRLVASAGLHRTDWALPKTEVGYWVRTGEVGKGFAVGATEVKALAGQVSRATENISGQISLIQQGTRTGYEGVQRVSSALGDMEQITSIISDSVSEQSIATAEIARRSREAVALNENLVVNADKIRHFIGAVSEQISQLASFAGSLAGHSSALHRHASEFVAAAKTE